MEMSLRVLTCSNNLFQQSEIVSPPIPRLSTGTSIPIISSCFQIDTIRLIDFGICQVQDGTIITLVDENVGARNYTSPECEAGNEESIHVYSDIYSASKVL